MIQANELRIGNYIVFNEDDAISKVIGIHTDIDGVDVQLNDEETYIELRQFSGIELTEGTLLKCGFEKDADFDMCGTCFLIASKHISIGWCGYLSIVIDGVFTPLNDGNFDKLHQLQNLYFALTGQELNVQP